MDYKTCEHAADYRCPECGKIEFLKKEKVKDDYDNNIIIVECLCGYKYWFHDGKKQEISLDEYVKMWEELHRMLGNKKFDIKTKTAKYKEFLQQYFFIKTNKYNEELPAVLLKEIEMRLWYDKELLKNI